MTSETGDDVKINIFVTEQMYMYVVLYTSVFNSAINANSINYMYTQT